MSFTQKATSAWEVRRIRYLVVRLSPTEHYLLSRVKSPPRSRASLHFCFRNVQEFPFVALSRPNLAVCAFCCRSSPANFPP